MFLGYSNNLDLDLAVAHTSVLNNGASSPAASVNPFCTTPTDEVKSEWQSCAICLEDMLESSLMVHPECNGILCHSCLEVG